MNLLSGGEHVEHGVLFRVRQEASETDVWFSKTMQRHALKKTMTERVFQRAVAKLFIC